MRAFNFSAGPATLPTEVMLEVQEQLLNWQNSGMSVMELSHRSPEFAGILNETELDLRDILALPDHYRIIFCQEGASAHWDMIPLNLLQGNHQADYIETGYWSYRAIEEGRRYCNINIAASNRIDHFSALPDRAEWRLNPKAAYVHYCSNETIDGLEFFWTPDVGNVPLVVDMSSHFLSRPMDITKFGMVYAGAQKNIGPAGLSLAIIREDLLKPAAPGTPFLMDYHGQFHAHSMLNTPPTFTIWVAGLVFKWIKRNGGLTQMAVRNAEKARLLYDFLDKSAFYRNSVKVQDRSLMNVPFHLREPALDEVFLKEAELSGLKQLRGHRVVGGMRASIYNAMPIEGVQALINFMADFERRYG
ncbi:3-phosphoserine/phosphohydroxythreonine transaminase [Ferrovum sp. PN-J185]|uniref:3-phosphoserine/phosphohydroxythreonine transaminase n=1 Tax=Ferrovum sp. PN-J185 TaxID=1356306 RepID=UPI000797716F|nr:3-phosphoserine/phosphohydroxythreonine transaminase [Ferrovum sp. PN-J185]KXW56877.1 phosphoserine aminotransferase [Ferrovum sp. PN-J185]MCC6069255.1 3-phosphoserine/phosphohydroxythreonine transaminase [Ferrovum sp. PN-J185]MDE1891443.1 3-phosphoserine/phosphohydroxythreonine transaminase [Betaproteobacteria bacterium]MDE2056031.1 3-phosphoserine/phosphohydroxythreonine transaminase [Betaproteobacteria bacterium]